ncbi:sodium:calcium antiporter [Thalassorhabdus alkalitolerans]|uniref:Sodium:calcium antiporter n=1 Tax=Thalassorhabdus alkalitolerans TaxID=2282697 RepID=A0ABW0YM65_9BACI
MAFFLFTIAAIFTVLAAIKLSTYADVLSEKSKLGGLLVGTLLLAGATSLPEVTTSLTAVVLDNPDIAVGNVLGSNMFNLLIIAVFDLFYRKEKLFGQTSKSHAYTSSLGLFLGLMVIFALFVRTDISILGIGLDSFLILAVYIGGMVLISRVKGEAPVQGNEEESDYHTHAISLKRAKIGFLIAAVIILLAGSVLTITGDQIAVITGLGSSFVGSFLIAASTSLPEAVSVLVALQLKNHNLALGSILGSNLFNIILLFVTDLAYQPAPILQAVSDVHMITAVAVTILSAIVLLSIFRGRKDHISFYPLPSAVLIVFYFVSSYLIFIA